MYEHFYHLKAEPFRLSPDHRFCFNHQSYAKAKAYMQYAFERAEGFVMVTGRPGTGKSTLVNDLVDTLSSSGAKVAKLVSTQLEAADLLRMVGHAFGLETEALDKATILQRLDKLLMSHHNDGRRALLIIDEAQDLSTSALEELRLLTNLQLNSHPLLQIFLLGQEELRAMVQGPGMEQVHQRLVAACHLEQLKEDETKAYIVHRLEQVGWQGDPAISNAIYPAVYRFSAGIPRRINQVCSRLFLHGGVEGSHKLGVADIKVVIAELQQEQLAFADTLSEINFDVVDDYDEYISQVTPAPETVRSAPASIEEPAVRQAAAAEPVAVDNEAAVDAIDAETQVAAETPVPRALPGNTLDAVNRFSPAADTDRSIRDQVISPSSRGHQALRRERVALQPVDVPAEADSKQVDAPAEEVAREKDCETARSSIQAIAANDMSDALINSPRRAVKPARNWLPVIAIVLVLLIGLSIAAVFVVRPKALEPQLDKIQSWLEEGADSARAIGSGGR
ncbi:MAG: AAA family ATPase [Gammaproteobacteria bacterium]|nr:AAA family ATPase [Gammaproteobacteria bacterium]MBQ0838625.1 AAA family ATPase [Gammaproteobacteria bacterium]